MAPCEGARGGPHAARSHGGNGLGRDAGCAPARADPRLRDGSGGSGRRPYGCESGVFRLRAEVDLNAGVGIAPGSLDKVGIVFNLELGYSFGSLGMHPFNLTAGIGFGHLFAYASYQPRLLSAGPAAARSLACATGSRSTCSATSATSRSTTRSRITWASFTRA